MSALAARGHNGRMHTAPSPAPAARSVCRFRSTRALTLVETMFAMTLMATTLLGFLGAFIQSRRITESSVLHAAATSLVYGIVEQIKTFDYTALVPSTSTDADQTTYDAFPGASSKAAPYIRVRLNQDQVTWLQCKTTGGAPTSRPSESATATSLNVPDNIIGPLSLSSVSGTSSQPLTLHVWVWIDEIPDVSRDVSEVKKITLVYSYSYVDGARTRTAIDREVFLRTRYDQ